MAWEKGKYYTRSRKVDGRVVREYVGSGEVAELIAESDAIERELRQLAQLEWKEVKQDLKSVDDELNELSKIIDSLTRLLLETLGYHQHHRGEWRKRHGKHQ
jgi:hypothetical protein